MSNWYVIKVLSGKERILNREFNEKIELGKINNITRFVCPTEQRYVIQRKKRISKEFVLYNGYLYFETENKLTDDELKFIGSQPSIIGLFGDKKPMLLHKSDVNRILKDDVLTEHVESKILKLIDGEEVTITDGPFNTFSGVIKKILGKNKVEIEVKIFDRPTLITVNRDEIVKK